MVCNDFLKTFVFIASRDNDQLIRACCLIMDENLTIQWYVFGVVAVCMHWPVDKCTWPLIC